jgi:guanylate kinase
MPLAVSIFILPPSRSALLSRLQGRGQDSADVIAARMAEAVSEMSHYNEFDYLVVNDVFERALTELEAIFMANRLTVSSQIEEHEVMISELLT